MIHRYRHKFDRTFVDAMQYFHGVNHVTLRDWLHDFGASSLMIYDKDLGSYCMLVKEYPSTLRREQKQKHMTKFKNLLTEGVYVLKHSDDTFTICNTKLFRATYIKIV